MTTEGPDGAMPPSTGRLEADIAALCDLVARGVQVDGELTYSEDQWFIYGRTAYDGEIILGRYDDEAEATSVLRAIPRPWS